MVKSLLRESADLLKVLRLIPAAAAALRLRDATFIEVNDDFTGLVGYGREDLLGRTSGELGLYPDPDDEAAFAQIIREGESIRGYDVRIRAKSGEIREAVLSSQAIELIDGPHQIVAFFDITERKRIEAALRASEERYRALTQSANDAIVSADQRGDITSWNSGAETIFGYTDNEIIGRPLTVLMPKRLHHAHLAGLRRFVETGESRVIGRTVELSGTRKDGSEFPMELSLATWKTADGRFFTGILRDISQRKIAEHGLQQKNQELADATQRLRYLSQTDELTGLNNRRGFLTRADEQLKLARRMAYVMSLVFIDVDGLKQINDTHGHAAGDNALTASSDILRDVFRESDLLARIGGDEFAVLAVNAGDDSAAIIRGRLKAALDAFNDASGHPYLLSFSLGQLSIPAGEARDVEELLAEADLAMYTDKLQKRAQRKG